MCSPRAVRTQDGMVARTPGARTDPAGGRQPSPNQGAQGSLAPAPPSPTAHLLDPGGHSFGSGVEDWRVATCPGVPSWKKHEARPAGRQAGAVPAPLLTCRVFGTSHWPFSWRGGQGKWGTKVVSCHHGQHCPGRTLPEPPPALFQTSTSAGATPGACVATSARTRLAPTTAAAPWASGSPLMAGPVKVRAGRGRVRSSVTASAPLPPGCPPPGETTTLPAAPRGTDSHLCPRAYQTTYGQGKDL